MIFEIYLVVFLVLAVVVGLLGWLLRPLFRAFARRWKFESDVARRLNNVGKIRDRRQAAQRAVAAGELLEWMRREGVPIPEEGMPLVMSRVVQEVIARNSDDPRVRKLAESYEAATGRPLPGLTKVESNSASSASTPEVAGSGAFDGNLDPHEIDALEAAHREVTEWVTVGATQGGDDNN